MSAIRHPNVVLFMGLCLEPPCIVTEFCARGSLYDVLKKARSTPAFAQQLDWSRRLSMALDAAKVNFLSCPGLPCPGLNRAGQLNCLPCRVLCWCYAVLCRSPTKRHLYCAVGVLSNLRSTLYFELVLDIALGIASLLAACSNSMLGSAMLCYAMPCHGVSCHALLACRILQCQASLMALFCFCP